MKKSFSAIVLVLVFALSSGAWAQTTEPPIDYLVRCDDLGMCHAVNIAVRRIIDAGIPLSVSVMFPCPWVDEAVDILRAHPEVSVGVHLTLNAEWKNYRWGPVSSPESVPGLVDSMGYFFPSRSRLFANQPTVEEIERECRAQIVMAVSTGLRIDYIDTHMGAAVQTPELRARIEGLAEEFDLGISGYFGESYSNITYGAPHGAKADSLRAHIERLGPGINLQVLHVGLDVPEMQAMWDLNPFGPAEMSRHRQGELDSILNPALPTLWESRGIRLITYRDLIRKLGRESMRAPRKDAY